MLTSCGGDDVNGGGSAAAEATATEEDSSGTGQTDLGPSMTIAEDLEACLVSPTVAAFSQAPYFAYRSILRVPAQSIALPSGAVEQTEASLSYTLQVDRAGTNLDGGTGIGAARIELDSVPSAIYFLEDAEGWDTAVYVDNPSAPTLRGDRLLLQVAYPAGSSDFRVDAFEELDREMRINLLAFAPAPTGSEIDLRSTSVPCSLDDAGVDRVDFTLTEGSVSFHTRAAFWRKFSGFTVLAEGEIDGNAFEVDSYWDLEYSSTDFASSMYGVDPLFGVRFPETPDGSCILIVRPDPMSFEGDYVAQLLDCEQNLLRDLTIESIDVDFGGGEPRW